MTPTRVRHVTDVPALGSLVVYDDATTRTADDTVLTRHDLYLLHRAVQQAMWAAEKQAKRPLRRPANVTDELDSLSDRN